jgi:hypothetical protein
MGKCRKTRSDTIKGVGSHQSSAIHRLGSYPIDEVIRYFGTDYFTNTVDYAIALAIYRKFTGIGLYGVNMSNATEYAYQKPGVEFWIGQAMGRGIKVTVHGNLSTILKTRDGLLYGYGIPQRII